MEAGGVLIKLFTDGTKSISDTKWILGSTTEIQHSIEII